MLLLFDRYVYAYILPTALMMDRLIAEGALPSILIVMVGHTDWAARLRELPCYAPFADFLAQELLPWVAQRNQVRVHSDRMVVGGMSYGGLAAAYPGFRYPEVFGNVLAESGSFFWKTDAQIVLQGISKMVVYSLRLGPFCDKLRQVCPARDIRAWSSAQSHLWYSWYC